MKILKTLNILYYACILAFIYLIPNVSEDAKIIKLILFLLTIGIFVLSASFYSMISFNKIYLGIKKYLYTNIGMMLIGIFATLSFGHPVYKMTDNLLILNGLFLVTFLSSLFSQNKINTILAKNHFDLMKEISMFFKMGHALEATALWKPLGKIDNYLLVYAVAVGIATEAIDYRLHIAVAVAGTILILAIRYLKIIKTEFLQSGLITSKETNLSIIVFYLSYFLSIVWMYFFPNLSVVLIASVSMLGIKLYAHRIAINVYNEKNGLS
jgi:hypothetical protein